MSTNLQKNAQSAYDQLIQLANSAYANSNNRELMAAGLGSMWLGKADAYEYAAHVLNAALIMSDVYLDVKETDQHRDVKEYQEEQNREVAHA